MLPSGAAQLIFSLHDAPLVCQGPPSSASPTVWSRGIVHGPQSGYYLAGAKPRGAAVGVSFRPGAAGAILGVPVLEVADRHVTIDDLWGSRGRALQERLREVGDPEMMFPILEQELTARLTRPLLIHPAVAHALARAGTIGPRIRVSDVQREAGYSARHFIELFRAAVGLTPSQFYRVKRFTTVLHALAQAQPSNEGSNMADLAMSTGYSDQSHLIREFKEFAGITPTQYRPRTPDSVHHHSVQIPTAGDRPRGKKNPRRP
jgi:AraC-like DNA-binding protein